MAHDNATSQVPFDLSGISVCIGMPVNRAIPFNTHCSVLKTAIALKDRGIPCEHRWSYGGSIIEKDRTHVAVDFLKSDCDRLFWIDSDISWEPADFLRILALSTKFDVVGATYPAKLDPPTYFINFDSRECVERNEYGLLKVRSFGLGFTCISRLAMETLAERAPLVKFPNEPEPVPHIFRCDHPDGVFRGEDIAFFADLRELGFDVWLDPTIRLGHNGDKEYTGNLMDTIKVANAPAACGIA